MHKPLIAITVLLFCTALAQASQTPGVQLGSIRCHGEVVKIGERAFRLLESCGDPDYREVVHYTRLRDRARLLGTRISVTSDDSVLLAVEEWIYKQGRGRLAKVLTVTGGVVTDIRVIGRQ